MAEKIFYNGFRADKHVRGPAPDAPSGAPIAGDAGKTVEIGSARDIFGAPRQPRTRAFIGKVLRHSGRT